MDAVFCYRKAYFLQTHNRTCHDNFHIRIEKAYFLIRKRGAKENASRFDFPCKLITVNPPPASSIPLLWALSPTVVATRHSRSVISNYALSARIDPGICPVYLAIVTTGT